MRALFWKAIKPEKHKTTIWKNFNDEKITSESEGLALNLELLETHFAVKKKKEKKKKKQEKKASKSTGPVIKKANIVDAERARGLSLAIARLGSPPKLAKAIMDIDTDHLTAGLVDKLVGGKLYPLPAETKKIREFVDAKNDERGFSKPERYLRALIDVPRIAQRLSALKAYNSYQHEFDLLEGKLEIVSEAMSLIRDTHSKEIQFLFEYILALGNYLNGKSARGGAYGFCLISLGKVKDAKSQAQSSFTLIDFIAKEFHSKGKQDCLRLVESWDYVKQARKVDLKQCDADLSSVESTMRRIQKELEAPEVEENDRFRIVMEAFVEDKSMLLEELRNDYQDFNAEFDELLRQFNEDPARMKNKHDFWKMMYDFAASLASAHDNIMQQEAIAEKEAQKRLSQEQRRISQRVSRKSIKLDSRPRSGEHPALARSQSTSGVRRNRGSRRLTGNRRRRGAAAPEPSQKLKEAARLATGGSF